MASDNKKPKPEAAPKKDAAAKVETTTAEAASKDAPNKNSPKPQGGDTAAAAPANYSRGEGQKPVTAAYKETGTRFSRKRARRRKRDSL